MTFVVARHYWEAPVQGLGQGISWGLLQIVGVYDSDKRMVDVSCDSEYMDEVMPQVGQAIRDTYHWVPREHPIFLYLDNAGGHGTQEIVDKYVKYLKDDFNVVCVHQRPRSPATNMLDLGVWMALQNVVERLHFKKRKELDALARTTEDAWGELESMKLTNVWNRWRLVLDLIVEGEGGDGMVEAKRGKLFRAPPEEAEVIEDVLEEEETELDWIHEADAELGGALC